MMPGPQTPVSVANLVDCISNNVDLQQQFPPEAKAVVRKRYGYLEV